MRERFAPRVLEADPASLLDESGSNLDPDRIWATMMKNEKPGGHGERSVAVGTIDMAVWDAVAKIAGKPLFRLLAEPHGTEADPRVFVYAEGGLGRPRVPECASCLARHPGLRRGRRRRFPGSSPGHARRLAMTVSDHRTTQVQSFEDA